MIRLRPAALIAAGNRRAQEVHLGIIRLLQQGTKADRHVDVINRKKG